MRIKLCLCYDGVYEEAGESAKDGMQGGRARSKLFRLGFGVCLAVGKDFENPMPRQFKSARVGRCPQAAAGDTRSHCSEEAVRIYALLEVRNRK